MIFMKNRFALSALAVAMFAAASSASAAEATGSFQVSAQVQGSCVVASADAIDFGSYDPTATHASAPLDAQGKVSVRCTSGSTNVKVALDEGSNANTGSTCAAPARRIKSAADGFVSYEIYSSAARNQVWACDAANEQTIASFSSSLVPVDLTTYGRIAGGQNAAIGTYTDTVGVKVTF